MSRIGPFILLLIFSLCLSSTNDNTYKWKMERRPGSGRFPENWKKGKWPMGIVPIVAFEDKLYIIGQRFTWISDDGLNWKARPKTDWGERHGMSFTFFNGKLWMMGGMKSWDKFYNDVWCSNDGFNWQQVKVKAEWSERRNHFVIVHNNKMILYGGAISSGKKDQTPREFFNDIWSSEDGKNWSRETANASWTPREPEIVKFKSKLLMIGGPDKSDIWSSDDGSNWKLVAERTPWKGRLNFGLQVFDNKLWFLGGREHNDVWSTNDGMNWVRQTSPTPWSTRTAKHSIVFANKLWVYSGKTGRDDSWSGEVWAMSK